MSPQTDYNLNMEKAYPGLVADMYTNDIISRSVETAAGIPFGVVVSKGTDEEKQCVIGGDGEPLGITVRSLSRENPDGSAAVEYAQYETAGIIRDGYVWAIVSDAGTPGDALNYVDATGVIGLGTPEAGETALPGTLETVVASGGDLGLIRIKN